MTTAINQTYDTDEFTELRVKVAFSELVAYEADRTFEIPVSIAHSPRAIRQFIADELDPDDLADDCTYENTTSCEDRSIDEVRVLQTSADHWRSDGVRQIAINRYMRFVRGPMTVWLAPDRKQPTGRCTVCSRLTALRVGAKAALHRRPREIEACPGTGHLVAQRDAVKTVPATAS
ncbi:hypothetical protein [Streptomyces graminilatus]|uniref:hypothetical protein n=1 Tax=Streptomyces graminilatus TaxID=1464070 RepID=UPI0006E1DB97|nr:hypothetical protein [Streptomyces graminilatus]